LNDAGAATTAVKRGAEENNAHFARDLLMMIIEYNVEEKKNTTVCV